MSFVGFKGFVDKLLEATALLCLFAFSSIIDRLGTASHIPAAAARYLAILVLLLAVEVLLSALRMLFLRFRARKMTGWWMDAIYEQGELWGGSVIRIGATESGFTIHGDSYRRKENSHELDTAPPVPDFDGIGIEFKEERGKICYCYKGQEPPNPHSGVGFYRFLKSRDQFDGAFLAYPLDPKRTVYGKRIPMSFWKRLCQHTPKAGEYRRSELQDYLQTMPASETPRLQTRNASDADMRRPSFINRITRFFG